MNHSLLTPSYRTLLPCPNSLIRKDFYLAATPSCMAPKCSHASVSSPKLHAITPPSPSLSTISVNLRAIMSAVSHVQNTLTWSSK